MNRKATESSPARPILYAAVVLLAVAIGGHLLVPSADVLWAVLAVFGVLAVPQALWMDRTERRNQQ